jgi:hypothetical protein
MADGKEFSEIEKKAILHQKGKVVNALDLYRPTEFQEPFFLAMEKTDVMEVLLAGGNRSGKSVCASIVMASILLNKPVTFRDGSKHYMRPERWRSEALKIWLVGMNWDHIGKTFHRLLFKPGLFRVIRDQQTGKWRSWDPSRPGEAEQQANTRPSPPLLRSDDVEGGESGFAWEDKKANQFKAFEMANDKTRIESFPSTGESPPMGDPVNIIWIDEAIENGKWYAELLVRLIDLRGRLLWTAYPSTAPSAEMSAIEERALEQVVTKDQTTYHFVLDGSKNPFTASKHRDKIMATMDEDELAARDRGVSNNDRWRMYPRFSKFVHRAYGPDDSKDDAIGRVLRNGVPANWTRYLILDPGTANPGVLFVAIPPSHLGDFIVPYDELYLHYTSAEPLAKAIAAKLGITPKHNGDVIEEMIADFRACRQTPAGFAGTIGQNYEKYFEQYGIKSRRHGSRFTPGSDDPYPRIMRVQGIMNLRHDGTTRLRILGCPHLVKQLERARWEKTSKGDPSDKPAQHQQIDISTCLEYFVSRDDCGYFAPPPQQPKGVPDHRSVVANLQKQLGVVSKESSSNSIVCGIS